jgi:hypothetical protein
MTTTTGTALPKPMHAARDLGPGSSAKILRALVWLLLGAAVVRAIGAGVGAWAAGSLGVLSTLFIGVVLPAWMLVYLPTWLAWRVLRPLGFRRAIRACLWMSPLASSRDLGSIDAFLDVLAGGPLPSSDTSNRRTIACGAGGFGDPPRVPIAIDAWMALAAALQAEQQNDRARANRILDALTHLPEGSRVPLLARGLGIESLAWIAFGRGDWALLLRYARLGDSRLLRSLTLLARAASGEAIRPAWLILQWALAPNRRATFPCLRKAITHPAKPRPIPPPVMSPPHETATLPDPRLRHLLLLGTAARGEPVHMRELLALADAWQAHLDGPAMAGLQARALELDAREGGKQSEALRQTVLDELTLLALAADGALPPSPVEELLPTESHGERTLGDHVVARVKEQLFEAVHAALRGLADQRETAAIDGLGAWERWLLLRSALDRLEARAGEQATSALWYSDVRNTVWGFACTLLNTRDRHQERAAWGAHMIFAWLAQRAECLNDVQAMLLNRENARMAQRAAGW